MIRKMKDEQLLPPLTNPLSIPVKGHDRSRNTSVDARVRCLHDFYCPRSILTASVVLLVGSCLSLLVFD
jgi:hypothetical protein